MTIHEFKDYTDSNASWTINDCLERVKEKAAEDPKRTQMIVILKSDAPGEMEFSRFTVNMRSTDQMSTLMVAVHDLQHEFYGGEV